MFVPLTVPVRPRTKGASIVPSKTQALPLSENLRICRRASTCKRTIERFRAISDNPKLRNTDDHLVDSRILDARLAMAAGDFPRAFSLVSDALRAHGYFEGARKSTLRAPLILGSAAALGAHRADTALRFARDARTIATIDAIADTQSAHVGVARLAEGRALLAQGDTVAARATLGRAIVALRHGMGDDHQVTREADSLLATLRH